MLDTHWLEVWNLGQIHRSIPLQGTQKHSPLIAIRVRKTQIVNLWVVSSGVFISNCLDNKYLGSWDLFFMEYGRAIDLTKAGCITHPLLNNPWPYLTTL